MSKKFNYEQNLMKAYRFDKPEKIPMFFGYGYTIYEDYDLDGLDYQMSKHPYLFPGFQRKDLVHSPKKYEAWLTKGLYVDSWGCEWKILKNGMLGSVVKHPVENWDQLDQLKIPDPDTSDGMSEHPWTFEEHLKIAEQAHKNGGIYQNGLEHGHTFLRLEALRGFENLILDMCDEDPRLWKLIDIVEQFSLERIKRIMKMDPDIVRVPEDLGTQTSSILSPELFRKYIKPTYKRICGEVRKNPKTLIHMHSDGYILNLLDDIMECGVDIYNLQDLVNGIDNIAEALKGRVAIDLDLDRQNITVKGSPKDCDDLIREEVEKLGSIQGGLSIVYQLWETVPLANAAAIMDAMEKYSDFYN